MASYRCQYRPSDVLTTSARHRDLGTCLGGSRHVRPWLYLPPALAAAMAKYQSAEPYAPPRVGERFRLLTAAAAP